MKKMLPRSLALVSAALVMPVLLAGCADIDPYYSEYKWQPQGTPSGNLAAMVVDPMDLVRGRGSDETDGGRAAAVITKWQKDGPGAKPLTGIGSVGSPSGGSGSGGS